MYFLFYILFILMVICSECSIIRADRFVFVFCLYFSHLVHRFSQQNGPSKWHKRFLRLLCTSKGKRRFCGVFSPSLYIFFSFPSPTDPFPTPLLYILPWSTPANNAYSNYIYFLYFLPYVIKYCWPPCMHFFHPKNIMWTDTMRRISFFAALGVHCISVFTANKGCIFNHADLFTSNVCMRTLYTLLRWPVGTTRPLLIQAHFILWFIVNYKTIRKLFNAIDILYIGYIHYERLIYYINHLWNGTTIHYTLIIVMEKGS